MARTALSKELCKIRIDHDINQATMAKELKVSHRELQVIELGKSPVTDGFLRAVAEKYADEDFVCNLYASLKNAMIGSISSVTFDLSELNIEQRRKVIDLRDEIAVENELANKQREEAKAQEAERKKKERLEKKAAKVSTSAGAEIKPEDYPNHPDGEVEPIKETKAEQAAKLNAGKIAPTNDGLSEEDLSILEELELDPA